ncbi:MAG: HEAT repeat domain-containing protein [Myxococcota bacterium]
MRRHLLIPVVLVALGCSQSPSESAQVRPVSAAASSVSARYAPGQQDTYRVSWTSQTRARGPAFMPEAAPVVGGLALEGTLVARWYASEGTPKVGLTLTDVESASLTLMGANVVSPLEELKGVEVIASVDSRGAVHAVHIPEHASPLARTMLSNLVGRLDFRAPTTDTSAVVPATHGTAEVAYVREGSTVRRALQRSVRLDAEVGGGQPLVAGEASLELDDSGALRSLSALDSVVVASGDERLLESETRLDLQRLASTHEPPVPVPDLADWDVLDPLAPPDPTDAARTLSRNFARGLTGFDISIAVRSAGHGLPPEPGFMVRAVGRLRGWPESADELVEVFDSTSAHKARRLVFDILASAGTPEAQRVMRELQSRPEVRADPDFPNWVQRWAFVQQPTTESASFLLRLHTDAFDSDDHDTRTALLYPMGSVSRQLEAGDPVTSAALLETIRTEIEPESDRRRLSAAVAGLGNAGRATDLPTLLAFSTHHDPQVRAGAAEALRLIATPEAEGRLLEMVGDDDDLVADRALAALGHIPRPEVPARLADASLNGQVNLEIASSVASKIIAAEIDEEVTRSAVQVLASATQSEHQQAMMNAWLDEIADAQWARG